MNNFKKIDWKEFGKRLQILRVRNGISQEQLGEVLDLSPRMISYIETGEKAPSTDNIYNIIQYFNVDFDYFVAEPALALSEESFDYKKSSPRKELIDSLMNKILRLSDEELAALELLLREKGE